MKSIASIVAAVLVIWVISGYLLYLCGFNAEDTVGIVLFTSVIVLFMGLSLAVLYQMFTSVKD